MIKCYFSYSYFFNKKKECGVTYFRPNIINSRIVGGVEAIPSSWPAQILLTFDYSPTILLPNKDEFKPTFTFYCGGTIIDERTILTASHCMAHKLTYYVSYEGNRYDFKPKITAKYPTFESMYSVHGGIHKSYEPGQIPLPRNQIKKIIMVIL
jgi:secreted trypsin-like serine protease